MQGIFGERERAHNECICTSNPSIFPSCTFEPRFGRGTASVIAKSSVCNYRPLSLLCSVSKVLERLIYNNIIP